MKKYLLILIIPFIFGCKSNDKEVALLKAKNDSLALQVRDRDNTVNGFLSNFNDIEKNLSVIKEKEKIISMNTVPKVELKQDAKDRINEDIKTIYDLLVKNKQIIASLNKKLKKSNIKIVELEKMIQNLTAQMQSKDVEINSLKEKLEKLNIDVSHLSANIDSLNKVSQNKQEVIEQKTSELNTAYYIIGTKKDLIAKNIITKEGGLIGIGKKTKLVSTFDNKNFIKIDITTVKTIPLLKKKATLLTTHPETSYKIDGKDKADNLIISNYQEFWRVSKYLVILVE